MRPDRQIRADLLRLKRALWALQYRAIGAAARWRRRAVAFAAFVLMPIIDAPVAVAAGGTGSVWLSWIGLKDKHGLKIDQYQLSVSQGGVTDVDTLGGAQIIGYFWDFYRLGIGVCIQMIDWVLGFEFLDMLRGPAASFATVMDDLVTTVGLIPVLGTIGVVMSMGLMLKGREGAGLAEMATTVVIAGLAGTALANPVERIAGDNGVIAVSQDLGAGITAKLLEDGGGQKGGTAADDPHKVVQNSVSSQLIDGFVRKPQQLLNFGIAIDGKDVSAKCKKSYDDWLHGHGISGIKDNCGDKVKDTIEHPQNSVVGAVVVGPAVAFLGGWAIVLLLITILMTALAIYEAAVFGLKLLKAILPGSNRSGLFEGIGTVFLAMAMLIASVVALGVYALVISGLFTNASSAGIVKTFLMVDAVSIAFLIMLICQVAKVRKNGREAGTKTAKALSPRQLSHVSSGRNVGSHAVRAARTGLAAARSRKMMNALTTVGVGAATGGVGAAAVKAGMMSRGMSVASKGANVLGKSAQGVGRASRTAAKYTVGAPVSVPRAVNSMKESTGARKEAFAQQREQLVDQIRSTAERGRVQLRDRRRAAENYRDEYVGNLKSGGRAINREAQTMGAYLMSGPKEAVRRREELTPQPEQRSTEPTWVNGRKVVGSTPITPEQRHEQLQAEKRTRAAEAEAMRRAQDGQPRPSARRWNETSANARSRRVVHAPTTTSTPSPQPASPEGAARQPAPRKGASGAAQTSPKVASPRGSQGGASGTGQTTSQAAALSGSQGGASAQRLKKELAKPQAARISGRGGRVA